MFCPTCQTVAREQYEFCPTCGDAMRAISACDTIDVVDSTAEVSANAQPIEAPIEDDLALPITATSRQVAVSLRLPVAVPALAIMAWRQPAVRAAVKTGASALVLSLTARAARHWLTSRAPQRALSQGLLPSLTNILANGDEPRSIRHSQGVQVSETFIYMRRVTRR